jgi:hypothetical protein
MGVRGFGAAVGFVARGEANLTRLLSPRSEDVPDPVGLPRPKVALHAADTDAELRPSPAQRSEDITQPHGMADDLGRSCERRLYRPERCQLISLPSRAKKKGYSPNVGAGVFTDVEDARRILDTVSRWEDWR